MACPRSWPGRAGPSPSPTKRESHGKGSPVDDRSRVPGASRRVLVAIHGREPAGWEHEVCRALALSPAPRSGCSPSPMSRPPSAALLPSARRSRARARDEWRRLEEATVDRRLDALLAGLSITPDVEWARVADADPGLRIVERAAARGADLIVVGVDGRAGSSGGSSERSTSGSSIRPAAPCSSCRRPSGRASAGGAAPRLPGWAGSGPRPRREARDADGHVLPVRRVLVAVRGLHGRRAAPPGRRPLRAAPRRARGALPGGGGVERGMGQPGPHLQRRRSTPTRSGRSRRSAAGRDPGLRPGGGRLAGRARVPDRLRGRELAVGGQHLRLRPGPRLLRRARALPAPRALLRDPGRPGLPRDLHLPGRAPHAVPLGDRGSSGRFLIVDGAEACCGTEEGWIPSGTR